MEVPNDAIEFDWPKKYEKEINLIMDTIRLMGYVVIVNLRDSAMIFDPSDIHIKKKGFLFKTKEENYNQIGSVWFMNASRGANISNDIVALDYGKNYDAFMRIATKLTTEIKGLKVKMFDNDFNDNFYNPVTKQAWHYSYWCGY